MKRKTENIKVIPGFTAEDSLRPQFENRYHNALIGAYYGTIAVISPARPPCCSNCDQYCDDCFSGQMPIGCRSVCAWCNRNCNASC